MRQALCEVLGNFFPNIIFGKKCPRTSQRAIFLWIFTVDFGRTEGEKVHFLVFRAMWKIIRIMDDPEVFSLSSPHNTIFILIDFKHRPLFFNVATKAK